MSANVERAKWRHFTISSRKWTKVATLSAAATPFFVVVFLCWLRIYPLKRNARSNRRMAAIPAIFFLCRQLWEQCQMMFIVKQSNTAFYYYHVCVEYIIEILHTFYSRICYDAVRDDFGSHRASRTTHWENRVQNGGKTKISYVCLIGNTFAICLHSIRPFWSMPNTKHADWCGCMSKCFSNYLWVRRNWDSFFFWSVEQT